MGTNLKLVGHDDKLAKILKVVRRAQANLSDREAPIGSFMLLGPTGVGKTMTARWLAEYLHKDPNKLVRIDCGEFQSDHELAKLVGAPPGYLGHRKTAPLLSTEVLKAATTEKCGMSVVLFDELEKASGDLHRMLLGVLDKGTLTTGANTTTNFTNSIIFMTANLGEYNRIRLGFDRDSKLIVPSNKINLTKVFSPEFINRVTEIYEFGRLTEENLLEIVSQEISKILGRVQEVVVGGYHLAGVFQQDFLRQIVYDAEPEYWGAREIKRLLQARVLDPIVDRVLDNKSVKGQYEGFEIIDERDKA